MQIHARKMNVDPDVNYEELARSTDDFNGAQVKQNRRAEGSLSNINRPLTGNKASRMRVNDSYLQCKAVCVEAGMIALRRESSLVTHEDFLDAVIEVQAKKKANLNYYA